MIIYRYRGVFIIEYVLGIKRPHPNFDDVINAFSIIASCLPIHYCMSAMQFKVKGVRCFYTKFGCGLLIPKTYLIIKTPL